MNALTLFYQYANTSTFHWPACIQLVYNFAVVALFALVYLLYYSLRRTLLILVVAAEQHSKTRKLQSLNLFNKFKIILVCVVFFMRNHVLVL